MYGYGEFSNTVTILAAQIPAQPDAPVTTFVAAEDNLVITWVAPDNGGSPITSYTILIRHSDGSSFLTQLDHCDGSDATVMAETSCTIPTTVLHDSPFSHPWASEIWAKVYATNIYGDSAESEIGSGAIIYYYPDAPVDLVEDMSDRSETTVGFRWSDGADPGGLPILDYKVTITSSDGLYNLVVENVPLNRHYVATDLTLGVTYHFEVQSRNSHGLSLTAGLHSILCAVAPLAPTDQYSVKSNENVVLLWTIPSD